MKKIRFLSALLALIMLLGMMTCFTTSVYADDDEDTTDPTETTEPGEGEGEGERLRGTWMEFLDRGV